MVIILYCLGNNDKKKSVHVQNRYNFSLDIFNLGLVESVVAKSTNQGTKCIYETSEDNGRQKGGTPPKYRSKLLLW
jgi:hypothetical protein